MHRRVLYALDPCQEDKCGCELGQQPDTVLHLQKESIVEQRNGFGESYVSEQSVTMRNPLTTILSMQCTAIDAHTLREYIARCDIDASLSPWSTDPTSARAAAHLHELMSDLMDMDPKKHPVLVFFTRSLKPYRWCLCFLLLFLALLAGTLSRVLPVVQLADTVM